MLPPYKQEGLHARGQQGIPCFPLSISNHRLQFSCQKEQCRSCFRDFYFAVVAVDVEEHGISVGYEEWSPSFVLLSCRISST